MIPRAFLLLTYVSATKELQSDIEQTTHAGKSTDALLISSSLNPRHPSSLTQQKARLPFSLLVAKNPDTLQQASSAAGLPARMSERLEGCCRGFWRISSDSKALLRLLADY
jgi:hypothetical protein